MRLALGDNLISERAIHDSRKRTDCVRRWPRMVFLTALTRLSLSLSPSECIAPCSRDRSSEEAIVDDDVIMMSSLLLQQIALEQQPSVRTLEQLKLCSERLKT